MEWYAILVMVLIILLLVGLFIFFIVMDFISENRNDRTHNEN